MRLQKLTIKNFRGIEHREITPDGKSLNIFGANALAKTSTASAGHWLLTDKDIDDRSTQSFSIKPRQVLPDGSLGEEIIGKEPMVEGVYTLSGGGEKTFRKVHAEKWENKRGHSEEVLTGYTVGYWIDDAPKSASDFQDELNSVIENEVMKQLMNPVYVPETMSKKDRRNLLLSLIHVSDQDIINNYPELRGYLELLDGQSKEDVESRLKERKDELVKQLGSRKKKGELAIRIEENEKDITEPEQSAADAKKKIGNLQEKVEDQREKLSQAQSGGGVSDLQVKVQEIEAQKQEARNEHQKQIEQSLSGARKKVSELQNRRDEVDSGVRDIRREYQNKESDLESAKQLVAEMEVKIETERNRKPEPKPDDEGPKVCPMCDQEIPQKDEADHYEKYVAEFNAKKADNIKSLSSELALLKGKAEQALKDLEEVEQRGLKANGRLSQVEQALDKAKADLEEKKSSHPEFDSSGFGKKQKALEEKINQIKLNRQSEVDSIKKYISDVEAEIEEYRKVMRLHESNTEKRKKIEVYQKQIKEFGKELNNIDQSLYLIEKFTRAKAEFVQDKVNEKFSLVKWRLFKEQLNGGIEERCDAVYNSQPWPDLSTSEKIKCGLDIINTLSKHYNASVPVWVDNRESCTELPETDLQIISLIVSPEDKKLRVEPVKELAVA